MRGEIKSYFNLIIIIFLAVLIFVPQAIAEEKAESKIQTATQKTSDTTRIVISTSGPVKFDSHWSDNPYRLIVEFKSKNVVGRIDKEAVVNQGLIKKITASYFSGAKFKAIKTLTFELAQKVPYKIWQEGNTILLDIQAPLESPGFSVGAKEKTLGGTESSNVIKRLEAMDTALKKTQAATQISLGPFSQPSRETLKNVVLAKPKQEKIVFAEPVKAKKNVLGILFWFIGLASVSGLGYLIWHKYVVARTRDMPERIEELRLQLEKKEKLLEQVEFIRKTVEETAIKKEKEYAQLKDVLVKRGIAKELTSPCGKEELWIPGNSPEKRNSPRLTLTKDFHNTVILKIELPGALHPIKSFAENISSGGICFQTQSAFNDNQPLNSRLFFYGGRVPIMKVQGRIVWKKIIESSNYYGLCFDWIGEKEKLEINTYIESKRRRS